MSLEPALEPKRLAAIRAPFEAFGGVAVDAPILQPLSLLLDLAGEGMRARLFVVQAEGAEEQALRPDFTIPVVETHIRSGASHGRYRYEGKAFLVAERGSQHPSEFLQIGAESFGAVDNTAKEDAGMAALAWRASRAGGRDDLSVKLGDPTLFSDFLSAIGLPEGVVTRLSRAFRSERALHRELDLAGASGAEPATGGGLAELLGGLKDAEAAQLLKEIWRLSGIQPVGGRSAEEIVQRLAAREEAARARRLTPGEADLIRRYLRLSDDPTKVLDAIDALARQAGGALDRTLSDWTLRLSTLAELTAGDAPDLTLSTAFIRPFGYYDGMLFEVASAALEPDQPVAGGGRYDGLPERLGGKPGAVGCMVRPGRAIVEASR